jgi:hypothetical protein
MQVSLSWRSGKGDLGHNYRESTKLDKDGKPLPLKRKHIDPERSDWNVVLCRKDMREIYKDEMTDALAEYNKLQMEKGHPERCKYLDGYIQGLFDGAAKSKKHAKPYNEIIVTYGARKDVPIYRLDANGNKVLTEEAKQAKMALESYYKDFVKRNPNMRVFAAVIHMDEEGAPHLHLDYIAFSREGKRGLKVKVSKSAAIAEQLAHQGIVIEKKTRFNNPTKVWTANERKAAAVVAEPYGLNVVDQHSEKRGNLPPEVFKAAVDYINRQLKMGLKEELVLPEIGTVKILGIKRDESAESYRNRVMKIVAEQFEEQRKAKRLAQLKADELMRKADVKMDEAEQYKRRLEKDFRLKQKELAKEKEAVVAERRKIEQVRISLEDRDKQNLYQRKLSELKKWEDSIRLSEDLLHEKFERMEKECEEMKKQAISDAMADFMKKANAYPNGLEIMDKLVLQRFRKENKKLYEKYLEEERREIFNAGRKANTRQRNNDWSL